MSLLSLSKILFVLLTRELPCQSSRRPLLSRIPTSRVSLGGSGLPMAIRVGDEMFLQPRRLISQHSSKPNVRRVLVVVFVPLKHFSHGRNIDG